LGIKELLRNIPSKTVRQILYGSAQIRPGSEDAQERELGNYVLRVDKPMKLLGINSLFLVGLSGSVRLSVRKRVRAGT